MDQISNHEEGEIPMPISSAYVGVLHGHAHDMTHHHHDHAPSFIIPPSSNNNNGTTPNIDEQQLQVQGYNGNFTEVVKKKVVVKYKECQKNHAASMGGNALDGCGEFMPSGEEGSIEGLTCCACNCHRNFHRKEIEGENGQFYPCRGGRKVILGSANVIPFTRSLPINVAYHDGHDGYGGYGNGGGVMVMKHNYGVNNQGVINNKKRFRTKFSQEQKEKMLEFAEKVGWKIQKQEESVVQQFCQEIGVKRRVLKVWMHNNKHTLANKTNNNNINVNLENNNNNNSSSSI